MINLKMIQAISTIAEFFENLNPSDHMQIADGCLIGMNLNTILEKFNKDVAIPYLEKDMENKTDNFDWNSLLNKPEDDDED